jgi:hypothetical protein
MPNAAISGLTASATNLAAADVLPVVQTTGVGPVKMTGQQLAGGLLGSTTLNGATLTANAPVPNLTQTWNNAAVTFTGMQLNITDTASNAGSMAINVQQSSVNRFAVRKDGVLLLGPSKLEMGASTSSDTGWYVHATNSFGYQASGTRAFITSAGTFEWGGSLFGAGDLILGRRAAANLRLGAADTTGATAPTPQFLSAQSWASSTTNNQTGANFTIDGSQGTGTGAGGSIIFRVAPAGGVANGVQNALVDAFTIASTQNATLIGSLTSGNPGGFNSVGLNMRFGTGVGAVMQANGSAFAQTNGTYLGVLSLGFSSAIGSTPDIILARDAANTIALRNGTNGQEQRTYGTFTDASNYRRVAAGMSTAGVGFIRPEGAGTGASGNVIHISGLPTSNPGPGILWNNAGTPAIGT